MFRPNAPSFQLLLSILFSLLRDEPWFSEGGEGSEEFPKTIPAQQKLLKKYMGENGSSAFYYYFDF